MMKRIPKTLLFVVLFIPALLSRSQTPEVDSLYTVYLRTSDDTAKVNLLVKMANACPDTYKVKALGFAREANELATRLNYSKGVLLAELFLADYNYNQLNYAEAIKHYLLAEQQAEALSRYEDLARIYNAMGIIYSNQTKHELSLQYFKKVAEISEQHLNEKRLAIAYNNIGISYKDMGRLWDAMDYYQRAMTIFEKTNFTRGIASASNNLGIISHVQGKDSLALFYYDKSIACFRQLKDSGSVSGIYVNIGEVYNDTRQYAKALHYYLNGLKLAEQYSDNKYRGDAYEGLSKVYYNIKEFQQAYDYLKLHLALKDSINNEEGMRQVAEMEKRLQNAKQEKEIETLKQTQEIQQLKVSSQEKELQVNRTLLYSLLLFLIVAVTMSVFIFRANKKIKSNHLILAEAKKEIQDSIHYAKNIQEAMLPDVSVLSNYFPEGFGLFLPKDVVSGDFYWFGELDDVVYFAAADCTGHGVPGAFMSMIGIDKLNHALNDEGIRSVGAILSHLNVTIRKSLKQENTASVTKDGMDIALCSYDKKSNRLCYAGANRPLWILSGGVIVEYKATKSAIAGHTANDQLFEEHTIQLQSGDSIYLFSDGFADQFGGPDKKKFMTKRLRETILKLSVLPMQEQELAFQQLFIDWKGALAQVDDVLLLGFKVA